MRAERYSQSHRLAGQLLLSYRLSVTPWLRQLRLSLCVHTWYLVLGRVGCWYDRIRRRVLSPDPVALGVAKLHCGTPWNIALRLFFFVNTAELPWMDLDRFDGCSSRTFLLVD